MWVTGIWQWVACWVIGWLVPQLRAGLCALQLRAGVSVPQLRAGLCVATVCAGLGRRDWALAWALVW